MWFVCRVSNEAVGQPASESVRDVSGLSVALEGEVLATGEATLPYVVVDASRAPIGAVSEFLRDLVACDCSPASVRSYAFDLLRWLRFLAAVGVDWSSASRAEVRDFVAWLRVADNPQRARQRPGRPAPGSVNPRTGKRYLAAGYAPATINHALSVLAAYYAYHAEAGTGPLVSPVPWAGRGPRAYAHHNPMEPFATRRRGAYRQKLERGQPRAIPEELFAELFATMTCHRDRALLSFYVSSCARPAELLGMTGADVDYGEQRIAVISKGSRLREWVPASPESFVWLALYLAEVPTLTPDRPLWLTRRPPPRPLTYTAMRAVLGRANTKLGANLSLHDLRHTGALRLAHDPAMAITDVQAVLRHRSLSSTIVYTREHIEDVIARVHEHYRRPPAPQPAGPAWAYESADLEELFGAPR